MSIKKIMKEKKPQMTTDLMIAINKIENIVSDDFCQDIEFDLVKKRLNKKEITMIKKIMEE